MLFHSRAKKYLHKYFTKLAKQQVEQEVKVRYFGFLSVLTRRMV